MDNPPPPLLEATPFPLPPSGARPEFPDLSRLAFCLLSPHGRKCWDSPELRLRPSSPHPPFLPQQFHPRLRMVSTTICRLISLTRSSAPSSWTTKTMAGSPSPQQRLLFIQPPNRTWFPLSLHAVLRSISNPGDLLAPEFVNLSTSSCPHRGATA